MDNEERIDLIRKRTDEATQYEQMAEECIELAHACLKKARILRGESPTPADIYRVDANIREELTDLHVCADVAGEKYDAGLYEKKVLRWCERLS